MTIEPTYFVFLHVKIITLLHDEVEFVERWWRWDSNPHRYGIYKLLSYAPGPLEQTTRYGVVLMEGWEDVIHYNLNIPMIFSIRNSDIDQDT